MRGGLPPHSSEALTIQPSGDKEQQGTEPFRWLGWKCEPKLIYLFTKLLSEVLSRCLPLLSEICLLKLPQYKRSRLGGGSVFPLLSLSSEDVGGDIPFDICLF